MDTISPACSVAGAYFLLRSGHCFAAWVAQQDNRWRLLPGVTSYAQNNKHIPMNARRKPWKFYFFLHGNLAGKEPTVKQFHCLSEFWMVMVFIVSYGRGIQCLALRDQCRRVTRGCWEYLDPRKYTLTGGRRRMAVTIRGPAVRIFSTVGFPV
jgi:hypothetical protein